MRVAETTECNSLNGTSLSNQGLRNCLKYKNIILLLDPDIPGRRASVKIKKQLASLVNVKIACPKKDPKYLSDEEIKELCSL